MEDESDSKMWVEILARQAETEADPEHPDDQGLLEYHSGTLDPETEELLRNHLVSCRQCTTQLLELAPLAEPEPIVDGELADLEVESSWRQLQGHLQSQLQGPLEVQRSGFGKRLPPQLRAAAAALLVLLPLGLAFDNFRLRKERLQGTSVTLVELQRTRSRGSATEIRPSVTPVVFRIKVKRPPSDPHRQEGYRFELKKGNEVLFMDQGYEPQNDYVNVSLPAVYFRQSGAYVLRLVGLRSGTFYDFSVHIPDEGARETSSGP